MRFFTVRVKSTACKPKQRGFALCTISSLVSEATNTCWVSGGNVKRRCNVDDAASVWMSSEWAANIRAEWWPSVPRTLLPCCVLQGDHYLWATAGQLLFQRTLALRAFCWKCISMATFEEEHTMMMLHQDQLAWFLKSLQICHVWVVQHLKVIHWLCTITHLTVILAGVIFATNRLLLGLLWCREQRDHRVTEERQAQAVNYLLCDNSH